MNLLFRPNRKQLIFILLIILALFIIGCQKNEPSIEKIDTSNITEISLTHGQDNTLNRLYSITDASSTRSFLVYQSLLTRFEEAIYNYTSALNIKNTPPELPTNLSILESPYTTSSNGYSFDIEIKNQMNTIKNYTLFLDIDLGQFFLYDSAYMYSLDSTFFDQLIKTGDFDDLFFPEIIPEVRISLGDAIITSSTSSTWLFQIVGDYYQVKSQESLLHLDPLIIKEPSTINLSYNLGAPSLIELSIFDDTNTLISTEIITSDHFSLPDINGLYKISLTSKWNKENRQIYGDLEQSFLIDMALEEEFTFNQSEYHPGDLVVLEGTHLNKETTYTIETSIYNEGLSFITSNNSNYLFIPLMSRLTPQDYTLTIIGTKDNIQTMSTELIVHVIYKDFGTQQLTTDASTASLQNDDNYDELNEAFARGRKSSAEEVLWTGPFIQPVGGRISTEYGLIRYTNGSTTGTVHSGIDFANPEGTPIIATQSGYITLNESLAITGNTIFIDHGFGLFSQYYHLFSSTVQVGDYVEAGEEIGTVGTTGFSSGPHLHFSIYYKGIYLNPWKFFEKTPF